MHFERQNFKIDLLQT